jgi:hypothetical protein
MKAPLRLLLLLAIVLTAISIVHTMIGVSAPLPERQAPRALSLEGYRVNTRASSPEGVDHDFSHGAIRRFRLEPRGGGTPLVLTVMPVRSRNEETLQMARMGDMEPSFSLRQRRLLSFGRSPGTNGGHQVDELAGGSGPKAPADPVTRLQTCLTPSGAAGVTVKTLHHSLRQTREAELARSRVRAYVSRFFGLQPNTRWECLAVQLETAQTPGDQHALLEAWSAVKPQLLKD